MKISNKYRILFAILFVIGILLLLPNNVYADEDAIILWDLNGGTGELPNISSAPWGTYFELPECTITPPEGKMFNKWFVQRYYGEKNGYIRTSGLCSRDPGGKFYTDTNTYFSDMGDNIGFRIYPLWVDKYTIILNPNGGTVEPTSIIMKSASDAVYEGLSNPFHTELSFDTWQRKITKISDIEAKSTHIRLYTSHSINSLQSTGAPKDSCFQLGDIISFDITVDNAEIYSAGCNDTEIQNQYFTISEDKHNIKCRMEYNERYRFGNYDFIDIYVRNQVDPTEDVFINHFYVLSNVGNGTRAFTYSDQTLIARWNHDEHDYHFHRGYNATYEADGKIDHYTCECGKYFIKNSDDTYEEVQVEDVTIPRVVIRYPLWLGTTRVTSINANDVLGDGTVSFDATTNTLTLNNATIENGGNSQYGWGLNYRGTEDFTIVANGTNVIRDNNTRSVLSAGIYVGNQNKSYSIDNSPKFTITTNENSTLTVTGGDVIKNSSDYHYSFGIYSSSLNEMTINGKGILYAYGGSENENTNSYYREYFYSYGILSNDKLTINSENNIISIGGNNGYYCYGLKANEIDVNMTTDASKSLSATGGKGSYSYGIEASTLNLNTGHVICTGDEAYYSSYGSSISTLNINDGKFEASSLQNSGRAICYAPNITEGLDAIGNTTNSSSIGAEIYNPNRNNYYTYFEAGENLVYDVTFNTSGATEIPVQKVIYSNLVVKPIEDPQRENYDFMGWYTDSNYRTEFDFENTIIDEDTEIFAKWNVQYVFPDVPADKWYAPGAKYCRDNGIMNGYADGNFGPDDEITRGQFVTILYRLAGTPSVEGIDNPFTDVEEGKYFTDAVKWAYAKEITTGKTATKFDPYGNVTRQEIAVFLTRYASKIMLLIVDTSYDITEIADYNNISSWAIPSLQFIMGKGIITGDMELGYPRILPRDNATRGQAALMFMRFCQMKIGK